MTNLRTILRLFRPLQWTKNLFVFAALVFSQHLLDPAYFLLSVRAFLAFSMTASFIYIVNDIADREHDRLHPKKRFRPIASGQVSLFQAVVLASIPLIAAIVLTANLPWTFILCLAAYLLQNLAYTYFLKNLVLIDVFVIAIGFMLRVIGGALVIDVPRSSWLILTTMFLSLFLGFAKRRGELVAIGTASPEDKAKYHTRKVLHHYSVDFVEQMTTICAAGFIFSYALYTVSERTVKMFGTENLIFTTPFVLYGIFRYLYLLHKKNLGESPTEVVLSDIPMIVNFGAYAIAMIAIIYLK
ncbi:MAG: decaprenyl-phosphate phosphoribosyltransferase [Bacteroidota bacterium]|nr:decaprenyl-phosphate phosphoribosyltransferase [Bacteroidota bacterium]MDP4233917.1 decaprenyl-phosphate phosphoribosyltransferase [Bacteroidota bacterium]MDP4242833.1 decaprenyl-phosphate phosphoribosyltransferase [Bacteroidota bacterium]MDP4288311.1 decaprenyl-phosphate phosphoribosyltransferase [Bacteroidota bacterium]